MLPFNARKRPITFNTNALLVGLVFSTLLVALSNISVIHSSGFGTVIEGDDTSSKLRTNDGVQESSSRRILIGQQRPQTSSQKYSRTFLGIFSRDNAPGAEQRQYYRTLFEKNWKNDPRTCSLPQFLGHVSSKGQLSSEDCLLIYTFVVGSYDPEDESIPAELVERIFSKPGGKQQNLSLLVDKISNPYSSDVNLPDVTRLNIRENDHDGKSQTFLNYAYREIMGNEEDYENPLVEYCMKISSDTYLSLDRYFAFARTNLAPAPFHNGVLAGALRDKSYWMTSSEDEEDDRRKNKRKQPDAPPAEDLPRLESFWGNEFEGIHLYMSGQLYILSYDLVNFILTEVPYSRLRVAPGGYVIGKEDHDISSMAFHSPTPLQVITIGVSQRFWEHPVKTSDHWRQLLLISDRQEKQG